MIQRHVWLPRGTDPLVFTDDVTDEIARHSANR